MEKSETFLYFNTICVRGYYNSVQPPPPPFEKFLDPPLNLTQLRKLFSTQLTLSTFHIVEFLITCHETLTRFLSNQKILIGILDF